MEEPPRQSAPGGAYPIGIRVGGTYKLRVRNPRLNGLKVEVLAFDDVVNNETGYRNVLVRDNSGINYRVGHQQLARIIDLPTSGHGLALLPFDLQEQIIKESGMFEPEKSRRWLESNMANVPGKGWKDWAKAYLPTVVATEPDYVTKSLVLQVWEFFRERGYNPWMQQLRSHGREFIADRGRLETDSDFYMRGITINRVGGVYHRIHLFSEFRRYPAYGPNGYAYAYDNNYAELETGAEFPRKFYELP